MTTRRQRAVLLAFIVALVAAVGLTSCAPRDGAAAGTTTVARVRVSGSGTCLPLLRLLAKGYGKSDLEFVFLPGLHSGGGIQGVIGRDLDIGAVSRDLTSEERKHGLVYTELCRDGLVIATHRSVDIEGLSSAQVRSIYAGRIRNWKEVGGPDLPIVVLDRNEDESAKMILREYVLGKQLVVTERAISLYYESDMVSALERTRGAIGYFSLGYAVHQKVPTNHLKLDGVAPTVQNVRNGSYGVVRPLGVVTKKGVPPAVRRFLEWSSSPEGMDLMEREGYAPAAK